MKSNLIAEISDCPAEQMLERLGAGDQPLIFRGIAANWPQVQAALRSTTAAENYLRQFYQQAIVTAYIAPAEANGRIFYNADFTDFSFERQRTTLDNVLDQMQQHSSDPQPPTFYVGSTSVTHLLPGFKQDNDLGLDALKPIHNIWIGNQLRVAAHFDAFDNIACVAAGRRRFTLFPQEQIDNLYIGPLDFTPAGQPISLVDFANPDLQQFPRFVHALEHAHVAELGPGDAIFIPAMWWHHVQSLDSFNVLINYWWRNAPAYLGSALDALNHALLSIRDLPAHQRAAWQKQFDHYVFNPDSTTTAHIPQAVQGPLAPLTEISARRLRGMLLNKLNR